MKNFLIWLLSTAAVICTLAGVPQVGAFLNVGAKAVQTVPDGASAVQK